MFHKVSKIVVICGITHPAQQGSTTPNTKNRLLCFIYVPYYVYTTTSGNSSRAPELKPLFQTDPSQPYPHSIKPAVAAPPYLGYPSTTTPTLAP